MAVTKNKRAGILDRRRMPPSSFAHVLVLVGHAENVQERLRRPDEAPALGKQAIQGEKGRERKMEEGGGLGILLK